MWPDHTSSTCYDSVHILFRTTKPTPASNGPPEVMLRPVGVGQFGDFDATPRISECMHELKLLIPLNFDSVAKISTACVSLGVYRLFLQFLTKINTIEIGPRCTMASS